MPASAPRPMRSLPWSLALPQSFSTRPSPRPTIQSAWPPPCATRSKPGAMPISPVAFRAAVGPNLQARSSGWSVHEATSDTRSSTVYERLKRHQVCRDLVIASRVIRSLLYQVDRLAAECEDRAHLLRTLRIDVEGC